MNMHGFIAPSETLAYRRRTFVRRLWDWVTGHKPYMLIVVLPTLLVAAYMYLIAANQYQSEAHFVIRSSDGSPVSGGGFGELLGLTGGTTPFQADAMGVADYLRSQQVVNTLRDNLDLVARFRRPEADVLSRLMPADPTPERLARYYNNKVKIHYNRDTNIAEVEVRAFRPEDAYVIIKTLLDLGERRVNYLNKRTFDDAVSSARRQLAEAEQGAASVQRDVTTFRQSHKDINPTGSGEAQIALVSRLTGELTAARAQLELMGSMINHESPQYSAMQMRVRSLTQEVARQSGQLTGDSSTIASRLGGYEDLKVRQEFAAKRYESAAASMERAREQARRQSLYLIRIVEPTMPVKSLYPERARVVGTLFLALSVAFGIGWLIVAGVREHAA